MCDNKLTVVEFVLVAVSEVFVYVVVDVVVEGGTVVVDKVK